MKLLERPPETQRRQIRGVIYGPDGRLASSPMNFGIGYGSKGASFYKDATKGWLDTSGSVDDDTWQNAQILRQRSRDLVQGSPLAAAAVDITATDVVNTGIHPQPCPDGELLGISPKKTEKLAAKIERAFRIWACDSECDFYHQFDYCTLQRLAMETIAQSGDAPTLVVLKERKSSPFLLKIRMIESDQVQNPITYDFVKDIIGGVERNDDGEIIAYHVRQLQPLTRVANLTQLEHYLEWVRVPAYTEAGRPNVLNPFRPRRPGQRRGFPLVSNVMEAMKVFNRYFDSEMTGALVSSYFTGFLTSPYPNSDLLQNIIPPEYMGKLWSGDSNELGLGPGIFNRLMPGESVAFPHTNRPSTAFPHFVDCLIMIIASALGIPKDILLKKFDASYSASRASLLAWWDTIHVWRQILITQWCQPLYNQLVAELVFTNVLSIPGYFEDPLVRYAANMCSWVGSSMPQLDEEKEIKAARDRVALTVSTLQKESKQMNGSDHSANIVQIGKEVKALNAIGVPHASVEAPAVVNKRIVENEDLTDPNADKDKESGKEDAKIYG